VLGARFLSSVLGVLLEIITTDKLEININNYIGGLGRGFRML
jgi:hypothetical protein